MNSIYDNILKSIAKGEKLLAVLIDPDKLGLSRVAEFIRKVNASIATHIFVGGSEVADALTEALVLEIKKH
ncbi:MAG TPA: geranylgeranylglyceryl/heptaprenylglyceryl phosphate synthase, partial [Flavobacteriaceae bacterium]